MSIATQPLERRLYIGGEWTPAADGRTMPVINPATEDLVAEVSEAGIADVDAALAAAARAQPPWSRLPGHERAAFLLRVSSLIRRDLDRIARIVTAEQGKPLAHARGEVDFAARFFEYFSTFGRGQTGEIMASENVDQDVWVRSIPYGVVVGIVAWNFPAALFARKVAPAIMAGNTIVLKPDSNTPLSALALAGLVEEAGVPAGVVNVLVGEGTVIGEALVRSPITRLVSVTGSVRAGRAIARAAAEDLTVISLELGGKAPFIVLEDADVEAAASAAVASRFANCGQVCTANERTYVHRRIADEFVERFAAGAAQLKMGNPLLPDIDLGPKITRAELDKVVRMVDIAREDGAEVILGGGRPDGPEFEKGFWLAPTVLTGVNHDMEIMRDEVFGPVAAIMTYDDLDEAIVLANDTRYGLSAYIYGNDLRATMQLVDRLTCGEIYVNNVGPEQVQGYHSGTGLSGYGGDDGLHGLERYMRRKSIYLSYGTP